MLDVTSLIPSLCCEFVLFVLFLLWAFKLSSFGFSAIIELNIGNVLHLIFFMVYFFMNVLEGL